MSFCFLCWSNRRLRERIGFNPRQISSRVFFFRCVEFFFFGFMCSGLLFQNWFLSRQKHPAEVVKMSRLFLHRIICPPPPYRLPQLASKLCSHHHPHSRSEKGSPLAPPPSQQQFFFRDAYRKIPNFYISFLGKKTKITIFFFGSVSRRLLPMEESEVHGVQFQGHVCRQPQHRFS